MNNHSDRFTSSDQSSNKHCFCFKFRPYLKELKNVTSLNLVVIIKCTFILIFFYKVQTSMVKIQITL